MDALSRLLMLNAPQGTIDKNCVLGSDWQLPHGAGELSVIRWHALTQGAAGNDSNLLIVFYVQIMPDDLVMQLHRF